MANQLVEVLLNFLAGVDVLEDSNLLSNGISHNLLELPPKEDFDLSLIALLKSNFVSIVIGENFLVGSPVLNSCVVGCSSEQLLLSQQVLIVESEETHALILVREGRVVYDAIPMEVLPPSKVVSIHPVFLVNNMTEDATSFSLSFQLSQSFNVVSLHVKPVGHHQSSVAILFAVAKNNLVLIRLELSDSGVHIDSGTSIHLRPN